MALHVRRVITGHDDHGKAIVQIDEVCKHLGSGRPGATAVNVWTTEGFPASNDGDVDAGLRKSVGHHAAERHHLPHHRVRSGPGRAQSPDGLDRLHRDHLG